MIFSSQRYKYIMIIQDNTVNLSFHYVFYYSKQPILQNSIILYLDYSVVFQLYKQEMKYMVELNINNLRCTVLENTREYSNNRYKTFS